MMTQMLICSLFCGGLWSVTKYEEYQDNVYGLVLAPLGKYANDHLPKWLYLPLLGCLNCMASIWGTIFYCYNNIETFKLIELIIFIFVVSALNGLYGRFFNQ